MIFTMRQRRARAQEPTMHWVAVKTLWPQEDLYSNDGRKLGEVVKYIHSPYWKAMSFQKRWRGTDRYFETIEKAKEYVEWLQRPWWKL